MAETDFLNKSVTAEDVTMVRNGTVLNLIVPYYQGYDRIALPPQPPPYWTYQRDAVLRATVHHEAMWAGAIGIAITKLASLAFNVVSKKPRIAAEAQDILLNADGERVGWVGFISKTVRDYLTADNGCFIEVVRATKAPKSKVVGLRHLDAIRVTRTGDPKIPAIYRDRGGRLHEMKDYQIIMFSDMPDPAETYYGVGLSAASRAYNAIYKLSSIEWYLREKVSGLHPLAIHIVNGVLDQQLRGAVEAAKQEQVSRGLVAYMGAVIVGIPSEQQPQVATIPLAELPDRFQRKEEFDIAVLTYANAIGLDVQDLQPLTGQSIGSGSQTQVLHDKARGKGIVAFKQDFTHAMNHYVLPDGVTFEWVEKDYRDISQQAAISKQLVDISAARITAQITSPQQEMQILIDADELPKEFSPMPHTPEENLSDTDDPEDDLDNIPVDAADQAALMGGLQPTQAPAPAPIDANTGKPVETQPVPTQPVPTQPLPGQPAPQPKVDPVTGQPVPEQPQPLMVKPPEPQLDQMGNEMAQPFQPKQPMLLPQAPPKVEVDPETGKPMPPGTVPIARAPDPAIAQMAEDIKRLTEMVAKLTGEPVEPNKVGDDDMVDEVVAERKAGKNGVNGVKKTPLTPKTPKTEPGKDEDALIMDAVHQTVKKKEDNGEAIRLLMETLRPATELANTIRITEAIEDGLQNGGSK